MKEFAYLRLAAGGLVAFLAASACASAADPAISEGEVIVTAAVQQIVEFQFLNAPTLSLAIPPPGNTVSQTGIRFRVTGNTIAMVSATPAEFLAVPEEGHIGRAEMGEQAIGYKIQVEFPRGSGSQLAGLPGVDGAGTPPLHADLSLVGSKDGVVHLLANPDWTSDGGLPPPGVYTGTVELTVSPGLVSAP